MFMYYILFALVVGFILYGRTLESYIDRTFDLGNIFARMYKTALFLYRHQSLILPVLLYCTLPLGLVVYMETYILIRLKTTSNPIDLELYSWMLPVGVDQLATCLGYAESQIIKVLERRGNTRVNWKILFVLDFVGIILGAGANLSHAEHHYRTYSNSSFCCGFGLLFVLPTLVIFYLLRCCTIGRRDQEPEQEEEHTGQFVVVHTNEQSTSIFQLNPNAPPSTNWTCLLATQLFLSVGLVTVGCFWSAFLDKAYSHYFPDLLKVKDYTSVCYINCLVKTTVMTLGRLAALCRLDTSPTNFGQYVLTAIVRVFGAIPVAMFGNSSHMTRFAQWLLLLLLSLMKP